VTVYLVGAGPGRPDLITVRGAELLRQAEVVVHDRLVDRALLDLAPPSARRIDVGKVPGHAHDQGSINALLVAEGRLGRRVVRLKGGDPYLFGRGGEEAAALEEAGVAYEVVPGVSAAFAAPAYGGVPLTHRGLSAAVTIVTAHDLSLDPQGPAASPSAAAGRTQRDLPGGVSGAEGPGEDGGLPGHRSTPAALWAELLSGGGTLVVMMGVAERGELARRLRAAGVEGGMPVAAISWGTWGRQRTWRGPLSALAEAALEAPATIVIGRVAALRLDWAERRPLQNWRVVVPRAAHQAGSLTSRLREEGAEPIELPVIAIDEPADGGRARRWAAGRLDRFDWVAFTSANGVERLLAEVPDARAFGRARLAAIGPGTQAALAAYRLRADLVAERYIAEGLLDVWPPAPEGGGRVLLARAAEARDVLPVGLLERGWSVEIVPVYRTVRPPIDHAAQARAAEADLVLLTAGSVAEAFGAAMGGRFRGRVAAIGPVTADAAVRAGLPVDVVASTHSIEGLVDAVCVAARHWARPVVVDPG